ncbi:MAG: ABC transporter permease subunit [Firmicutes bacterium]|nr:ABC transporter permease subunit [Bacillota bacterium]
MRIAAIIRKEWEEALRNWLVLSSIVIPPVLFIGIQLMAFREALSKTADPRMQQALVSQMMTMYLFIPLIAPTSILAYSVVGEKTNRSLEPLLATPITDSEFMLGKALAGIIPGLASTWGAYGLFLVAAWLVIGPWIMPVVASPTWLLIILVMGSILSFDAAMLELIVSSRVNDPRAAQQLGAMLVIPVVILSIGLGLGKVLIGPVTVLAACAVLLVVGCFMFRAAVSLFQRETILTRWK